MSQFSIRTQYCVVLSIWLLGMGFKNTTALAQASNIPGFVDQYAIEHDFSGAIVIEDHGKVVMNKYYGMANQEFRIPNKPGTRFKLASITKLFTSTLIMQLHDEGLIDLQKPISAYLPAYKGEGADKVTVYELLTATSGIDNFGENSTDAYDVLSTSDDLLNKYSSGKLISAPGTKWNYNNADFVILGKILKQ